MKTVKYIFLVFLGITFFLDVKLQAKPILPKSYLPLPIVVQETNYSCGAASLLSVLSYWGVFSGEESELYEPLGTTPEDGTEPTKIVAVAESYGLKTSLKEHVNIDDLKKAVKKGISVILDLQAWRSEEEKKLSWANVWESGHYVVVVGIDHRYAYFMDPSAGPAYAYTSLWELDERWHDYEDGSEGVSRSDHLAIFIQGTAPFKKKPRSLILME